MQNWNRFVLKGLSSVSIFWSPKWKIETRCWCWTLCLWRWWNYFNPPPVSFKLCFYPRAFLSSSLINIQVLMMRDQGFCTNPTIFKFLFCVLKDNTEKKFEVYKMCKLTGTWLLKNFEIIMQMSWIIWTLTQKFFKLP